MRRTLIPLLIAAGLLFPAAAVAVAAATTYTARSGPLSARLTSMGTPAKPSAPTLTVTRGSTTLFQGSVTARGCGTGCEPESSPIAPALKFAPLDGTGSHDLLVNLYSGGANCCSVLRVLRPSAALDGRYVASAQHNFAYDGYRLERRGGSEVFITADSAFAFAFTDFADSGMPLQILHLDGVNFQNVTAHYPALVRRDAASWLTAFHKASRSNDVGEIAAWAADEATLDRWRSAHAFLLAQARAGHLHSTLYPRASSGLRFVSELQTLLRRNGYLRRRTTTLQPGPCVLSGAEADSCAIAPAASW